MKTMTSRRQFIGTAGSSLLGLLLGEHALANTPKQGEFLFLEAEGFDDLGGWDVDQQSMDYMGSPYLLAHGLGIPVKDATTKTKFPSTGSYRIWVRTRDWVAPWNVPGTPGKFQVLLDQKPVKETFGTKNAEWHWHDGGIVDIDKVNKEISLHDLTGFEGRCEAVLFCKDTSFKPSNDVKALTNFRRKLLGLPDKPKEGKSYDLVICGGGFAGTAAALSAARLGLNVALIQDRPVLGGNGSTEVRVWPEGHVQQEPYTHVGDIVYELFIDRKQQRDVYGQGSFNRRSGDFYDDEMKMAAVKAEPRIDLYAENRAITTETTGNKITSVIIQSTRTSEQERIYGTYFADCTGDATIGYQAGADYEFSPVGNMGSSNLWSVLDASDQKQVLKCECKDKEALTVNYEEGKTAQPFPSCPWAVDLHDKPFPGRAKFHKDPAGDKKYGDGTNNLDDLGRWYWESGFDRDPIEDVERIRDLNLRAMYGAWDALKNTDGLYPNHRLGWAAFIAGKRESRRLMGDVVLDAEDFYAKKEFEDGCFPCSWHVDIHTPNDAFDDGHKGNEFISDFTRGEKFKYSGTYWAPYRTLYSRNVENLFMAGRNISVTKTGLGPVRVMKTCGTMGEIVGKAASLCVKHKATPRDIYAKHLDSLKELMKLPGKHRIS